MSDFARMSERPLPAFCFWFITLTLLRMVRRSFVFIVVASFSQRAVFRAVSARTLNSKSASFAVRLDVDSMDSFLLAQRVKDSNDWADGSYSVGVQAMVVVVGIFLRVVDGSESLSSFSPPSKIGINLICDCPIDAFSSEVCPLVGFLVLGALLTVSMELRKTSADIDREANVRRNRLLMLLLIIFSFLDGDLGKKRSVRTRIFERDRTNRARLKPEKVAVAHRCWATLSIWTSYEKYELKFVEMDQSSYSSSFRHP